MYDLFRDKTNYFAGLVHDFAKLIYLANIFNLQSSFSKAVVGPLDKARH